MVDSQGIPLNVALAIIELVPDAATRARLTRFVNGEGEHHLRAGPDMDALNAALELWAATTIH